MSLQTPEVRTGVKLQEVLSTGEDGVRYVKFLEDDQACRRQSIFFNLGFRYYLLWTPTMVNRIKFLNKNPVLGCKAPLGSSGVGPSSCRVACLGVACVQKLFGFESASVFAAEKELANGSS